MDILGTEEKTGTVPITYEEKIKDKKAKNTMTKRWRKLGLLDGIQPNSKTEKLIIEMYERMTIYILYEYKISKWFTTSIYPMIRLLYTGEKSTGKKINFIVKPEDLIETFSSIRMDEMKAIFERNVPKSVFNRVQPLFNLIEYKHLGKKTVVDLDEKEFILSPEEVSILTALLPNRNKTKFDFEAEILAMINSCCVFVLKETKKTNKNR